MSTEPLNPYAVLEVAPGCPDAEIQEAYERAKLQLGPDSLATYGLVDPHEARAMLARVEEAYGLIGNPERRRIYDQSRLVTEPAPAQPPAAAFFPVPVPVPAQVPAPAPAPAPAQVSVPVPVLVLVPAPAPVLEPAPASAIEATPVLAPVLEPAPAPSVSALALPAVSAPPASPADTPAPALSPAPVSDSPPSPAPVPTPTPVAAPETPPTELAAAGPGPAAGEGAAKPAATGAEASETAKPVHKTEADIPPDVPVTGEALRKVREARGLTLADLAGRTKIGHWHLENIEKERYKDLPAQVYLRGFLMCLARELRLDPVRVSRSYIDHMEKPPKPP